MLLSFWRASSGERARRFLTADTSRHAVLMNCLTKGRLRSSARRLLGRREQCHRFFAAATIAAHPSGLSRRFLRFRMPAAPVKAARERPASPPRCRSVRLALERCHDRWHLDPSVHPDGVWLRGALDVPAEHWERESTIRFC